MCNGSPADVSQSNVLLIGGAWRGSDMTALVHQPSSIPLRVSLEAAAQVALDAAERIVAVLNRIDGDLDLEDSADAELSLV
jgi:hypothetical protein